MLNWYYHRVDNSAGGQLVPEIIFLPIVSALAHNNGY